MSRKTLYYRTNGNNGQPIVNKPVPRRNEPCPCGSGKKAKKCCLGKIKFFASLTDEQRNNIITGRLLRPQVLDTTPAVVSDAFNAVSTDAESSGMGMTTGMVESPLRNWDDLSQEEQAAILTADAIERGSDGAVGHPGPVGPVGPGCEPQGLYEYGLGCESGVQGPTGVQG